MGLFGRKKKAKIKTPFGDAVEFTTERELPDDLPTLRAMGYYYTYREKNREYAYYIDKKIISLDTEKKYTDSIKRMAMYYFDGFMVPRDNKEGSRIFIEWMDRRFLGDTDLRCVMSALKEYFYYGFRSYSYLLDISMRRIELDIKNNAEPVGMCIYQNVLELWQYSKLVDILGLGPANATKYFEVLKENFNLPSAEFMLELVLGKKDPGLYYQSDKLYKKMEGFAAKGNVLALLYILDEWFFCVDKKEKDKNKLGDYRRYKAEYDRILNEYKMLQHSYDHSQNVALKEKTDVQLLKYAEFFKGTCTELPADYPFEKKETSLYYKMERFIADYNALYALWPKRTPADLNRVNSLLDNISEYGEFFIQKKHLFGMYQALFSKANFAGIAEISLSPEEIYNKLVEGNYEPALKLGKEVTEENRTLLLKLNLNEELTKEEAERLYMLALKEADAENWESALSDLSSAKRYGKIIPENQKQRIVRKSVVQACEAYDRNDKSMELSDICYVLATAADSFREPVACLYYATILNNDKRYFSEALTYVKKALEYKGYSYVYGGPAKETFDQVAGELYDIIQSNMD